MDISTYRETGEPRLLCQAPTTHVRSGGSTVDLNGAGRRLSEGVDAEKVDRILEVVIELRQETKNQTKRLDSAVGDGKDRGRRIGDLERVSEKLAERIAGMERAHAKDVDELKAKVRDARKEAAEKVASAYKTITVAVGAVVTAAVILLRVWGAIR